MIQVIQSCSIETTDNIHDVVENYRLMESSLLWNSARCINPTPLSILNLIAKQIIETLLTGVDSTEDKNGLFHDNSGVPVTWLRSNTLESPNFKPKIGREAILVDIVHRVVTIPTAYDEH